VEEKARKSGGYGKSMVSIWDVPKGGLEKSPAYRKMLTRCELDKNGKPPRPEDRDGAPVKGGFPVNKYPPNVVVDGYRACWLPDDWAQVMKNTGPGGVYHGWMSPEGKFFYHRTGYPSAIEETLGRKLKLADGMNGLLRSVKNSVKPGADKEFLRDCLKAAEKKCIAPATEFHFAVVSARRASNESGQHDILKVEGLFQQVGVVPTWYVDGPSLEDYKKMGLTAKVGGKLTPARNMALDDAKKRGKVCVQVSDDISKWMFYDCEKQDFRGEKDFKKANATILGVKKHVISPLAAAQFLLAKMRADPDSPRLGGVFPTANAAMTMGQAEVGKQQFILGDFFVAEPSSPCRFDTEITLKEDYDYTCSHIKQHGCVLRSNRMFLQVKHVSNAGGAVASRDAQGEKEKQNIDILQRKWPGVFTLNKNRKDADTEVRMTWRKTDNAQSVSPKGGQNAGIVVKKTILKAQPKILFSPHATLQYTGKIKKDFVTKRCKQCDSKEVQACLGMKYLDSNGVQQTYKISDLKYDLAGGALRIK